MLLAVTGASVWTPGCGDDAAVDDADADAAGDADAGHSQDADAGHGASIDRACAELAQALCARRAECSACSMPGRYGDPEDCDEIERHLCAAQLSLDDVNRDPSGVLSARDQIENASCAALEAPVRVTVHSGGRRRGEPCAADAQCENGAVCGGTRDRGCAHCGDEPPPAQGTAGDSCVPRPEPWIATGESCGAALSLPDLGACAPSDVCALPADVNPGTYDGYGICKPRPGLGDGCSPYYRREYSTCPSALVCVDFVCRAELACENDPAD